MNIHRVGTYLIPLESWEGAKHHPVYRIGIGGLIVEESDVKSNGACKAHSLITEASCMDIHHVETYLILLESWEGAEDRPVDRVGIDGLAGAESCFEYWDCQ